MGDYLMPVAAGWYPDPNDARLLRWWDGTAWSAHTSPATPAVAAAAGPPPLPHGAQHAAASLREEIARLQAERDALAASVVELREVFVLQEVGRYEYQHKLLTSEKFKAALKQVEDEQAASIKQRTAVKGTTKWAINGSEKEGLKMIDDFCKLMLRAYNAEAEAILSKLKPFTLKPSIDRLQKMRDAIAKLGASMKIEITDHYHRLRVKELELTCDLLNQLNEERERDRAARAQMKEDAAAQRELEAAEERLDKEKGHYENALVGFIKRGDESAAAAARAKIVEIQAAIDGVHERAANIRAGFVYVISNIGSFGETVVKIGMTRREDPMDRVRELGDASVPFRFDVHALIFSDDAVGLETALHQRFAPQRVNAVNHHREFFHVTPVQVKEALLTLKGDFIEFTETVEALEWHQTKNLSRTVAASQ